MPDREQLYQALRNADAAGDTEGAKKLATYIQSIGNAPVTLPAVSDGIAQGQRIMNDIDQANHESGTLLKGAGESVANIATGLGSAAVGGLRGYFEAIAALKNGANLDDAVAAGAKKSQEIQNEYTYQPRTGVGKLGSEFASLPINIAKSATSSMGGDIGEAVNGAQGRVAGEAIGNVLPDVAATLAGGSALKSYLAKKSIPAAEAASNYTDYVQDKNAPFVAEDAATMNGEPMADTSIPPPAAGMGSVGAAAGNPASMAAATGASPAILFAINQAGDTVHPVAAARHAEASSLPVPVDLTAGQASGNAELLSTEKNNRGKYPELGDIFNRQNDQLIQNFDEVRQQVAPDVAARGTDLGQMAVDAYKDMDAPVRADITEKYKALEDANGGEFPLNTRDFVVTADEALKKANRTRFLPSEVQGILSDLREGSQMTFADFENYRTILAEQARKADRAGDGTAAYAVGLVRNALESLPMIEESATIRPLADAARAAAKARFDRINSDPAYKAAINDGVAAGEPSPLADKFIQSYVVKGRTANVQNMLSNLSNDPLNRQILAAGVIDDLKNSAGIDLRTNIGNVTQKGLNSGIVTLDKKAPLLLGQYAANTINTLGNVARYTMEQNKGTFVNNSNTTVAGAAMQGGKELALGALDVKTLGATKFLRNILDKRALEKSVRKSVAPGAGINYADFPSLQAEILRNAPTQAPESLPTNPLSAYIADTKHKKAMQDLSNAKTVDDAIKAVSDQ